MRFGAVWFLMAIFIVTIVGGFLIDIINEEVLLIVVSIILAIIGIICSNVGISSLFRWKQALTCVPAFILGHLYRRYENRQLLDFRLTIFAFMFGSVGIIV